MFQSLLEKLTKPRHEFIPNLSPFPSPDASLIATSLDVRKRAAQDGARDYPSADSDQPTSTELEIQSRFQEIVRQTEQILSDQRNAYASRIRSSDIDEADVSEALADGRKALERARERNRNAQSELEGLRAERLEAENEFEQFRRRNSLQHRMPSYPEDRRTHVAVLVLLVVVESIINGLFFAKGSERGIVGGVGAAVILSALNLGLGFLSGLLAWRGACSGGLRRVAGLLGVLFWAFLAFELNHFVACYRDLFALNSGVVPLVDAFKRMGLGLDGLTDAESLVLLLLGISLNILAALDGFRFDDSYIGYGATDRRRRIAIDRFERAIREQAEANAALKDVAFDAIRLALKAVKDRSADRARADLGRNELAQAYSRHKEIVQGALGAVLRTYWEANELSRTKPSPGRFQGPTPKLAWLELPTEEAIPASSSGLVQGLEAGLDRLMAEWRELRFDFAGTQQEQATGSTVDGGRDGSEGAI